MLLRSLLSVIFLRIIALALTLGYVALIALWVAPEEYGRYSLVLSVALVIAATLLSWPNQATLRYGREDYVKTGGFGAIFSARVALHFAGLVLFVPFLAFGVSGLAAWLDVQVWPLFAIMCAVLFLYPAVEFASVAAQIVGRYLIFGLSPIVQRVVQLGLLIVVAQWMAVDWLLLLSGNLLGYILVLVLLAWMMPLGAICPIRINTKQIRRLLDYSWAMPMASLSAYIMSQMDLWFLHYFSPLESVGVYAWAYNVSLFATSLLVPLSAVLAPRSIDLQVNHDADGISGLLSLMHAVLVLAAALMPAILGVALWSFSWLSLGAYESARVPLFILASGTLFQMGMALLEAFLFSCRPLVTLTVLLFVAMALFNAILNYLLIPPLGLAGPALATATVFAIGMVAEWHLLARHYAAGCPPKPWLRLIWVAIPLFLLYPMFQLSDYYALIVGCCISIAMIMLARWLGWLAALEKLRPRLWRSIQPIWAWLAQPRSVHF